MSFLQRFSSAAVPPRGLGGLFLFLAAAAAATATAAAAAAAAAANGPLVLGERLSPDSSILVSVRPEDLQTLGEALPFQFANVTLPEQKLTAATHLGSFYSQKLKDENVSFLKPLRTTVLQCLDRAIKVEVLKDFSVRCLEGGVASLVSLSNFQLREGRPFAQLSVHFEWGGIASSASKPLPLASLNPNLWGPDRQRMARGFRGTAICLQRGSQLQLLEGWPVRVPEFKDGPWEARVLVERCFLTPSSSKKEHLLHATLRVLKAPKDKPFVEGPNPKEISFAGYVKLPSKYHGLEAAFIKERLIGRSCFLRRTETKSTVELKCDAFMDAKLASINKLYADRPPLLHALKSAGLLMGGSLGAFALAAFMQMFKGTDGKPAGDPEGCMAVGALSAVISLLTFFVETPRLAYQYLKWRKKFKRKATRVLEESVSQALVSPGSKSPFLDLVLIAPAVRGGPEDGGPPGGPPPLTEGQEEGYAELLLLLQLRAAAAAQQELPFDAEELQQLGLQRPEEEEEEEQQQQQLLERMQQHSSITGIQVAADNSVSLPSHMSPGELQQGLIAAEKEAVQQLLQQQLSPFFCVSLLRARNLKRHLWKELAALAASKQQLAAAPRGQQQQQQQQQQQPLIDFTPLTVWVAVFQRLKEAGQLLQQLQQRQQQSEQQQQQSEQQQQQEEEKQQPKEQQEGEDAAAAAAAAAGSSYSPELLQRVAAAQLAEEAALMSLIRESVKEEVRVLSQVAANLEREGPGQAAAAAAAAAVREKLRGLRNTLEPLQQHEQQLQQQQREQQQQEQQLLELLLPAEQRLQRALENNSSEEFPLEPFEDPTDYSGVRTPQEPAAAKDKDAEEEDDKDLQMIDFDFD
ncbi:Chaperone protein dnaJ, related, related [Eimeria tenella]|uniref:Chaperone protein dnaJ, related, related n=1 Tax=Eimeria tenella TaxID=5802 RepID=U6L675_EIMTE|nr:Chaperone protein dnaJ, related, related [Eimeria tenella]CDJ44079.1 Chaperone protein dnaJ, related, related [Eimeria tenella]|eukprot:XP_013234828.1 Chaperone protein dnaJ, related, related [Eimeria tenella]